MFSDWRDLPFREIWAVDTEFHPGAGFNAGARDGDPIEPVCVCALELRSGREVKLWRDQLGSAPPYNIGPESLVIAYSMAAEFGVHVALGWDKPACSLDVAIEYRMFVNNGGVSAADREPGALSLDGALRYFGDKGLNVSHKQDMRDAILSGGPFTDDIKREIIEYCFDDVLALSRLFPHVVKKIRSLPHAMLRASYQWAAACQERRGVPLDLLTLERLRANWQALRLRLVQALDGAVGIYEIVDGTPHWRSHKFAEFVSRNGLTWPRLGSGALDESADAFRDMASRYPAIEPLKELRSSLAQLRLNSLAVGHDGRNRTQFWAFSTKTGRNAPRASRFVFGPAKWIRFLVSPPRHLAITHRDYCQQEVQIAAIVSGDNELLAACNSGDVYLGVAKQLGFAPDDATPETHDDVRSLFKTVVLGISYGLGPGSLAERTGVSLVEAREILARMRARFHRFEDYMASVSDQAGLDLELRTSFDWRMVCPPETNPRTIRNFPMQSAGAEILRVASIIAERRRIRVLAPVHDALMAEGAEGEIEEVSAALNRAMRDASAIVLQGYELRTDEQIVRPGQRFFDKRGASMWETVSGLLDDLER